LPVATENTDFFLYLQSSVDQYIKLRDVNVSTQPGHPSVGGRNEYRLAKAETLTGTPRDAPALYP